VAEARAIPTRRTTPRLRRGAVRALATILFDEWDEEAWARHIPADYQGERPEILHEFILLLAIHTQDDRPVSAIARMIYSRTRGFCVRTASIPAAGPTPAKPASAADVRRCDPLLHSSHR
jgi:hypothetical protein